MTDNNDVLSMDNKDADPAPNNENNSGLTEEERSALAKLVGDGKKFKDEEDLARGKLEADAFIDQLKEELRGLREDLKRATDERKANETRDELAKLREQISQRQTDTESKENTTPELATEDLEKMIENHITARETRATAKSNLDQTNRDLIEHYGDRDKAAEAVKARADELGLSVDQITEMASKSPRAAMALVRGDAGSTRPATIDKSSSVSSEAVSDGIAKLSTKAQFEELRRKNPTAYWDPKVQNQIHRLAREGKYL
jgi:chromosome segregation ATPase